MKLASLQHHKHCSIVYTNESRNPQKFEQIPIKKNPFCLEHLHSKLAKAALTAALSLTLITAPNPSFASTDILAVDDAHPIIDIAKVIPRDKLDPLTNQLKTL